MKNRKKGISLIVLIITIIVIIILAAAIILSMVKNNPIKNAKKAVSENDVKVAQEAVTVWIGDRWGNENNGSIGEEVGALYTGKVTKELSEVEVNLDGKISTIQVTLEELGLEMLEEVVIEKNVVKSIVKNGSTYPGKDEISGDNNNSGNDQTVEIDKEKYEALTNRITELENKVSTMKGEVDTQIEEIRNIQKSALVVEEVFNGKANASGSTYEIKNISGYRYLFVYVGFTVGNLDAMQTNVIKVEDIVYGNGGNYCVSYGSTSYYNIGFNFTNGTTLKINQIGCSSNYASKKPGIYKIEGIK